MEELIKAGAVSFKIEGRMKSVYYVALVTKIYREVIEGKREVESGKRELGNVSHRHYCTGFYLGDVDRENQGEDATVRNYTFVGVVENHNLETKLKDSFIYDEIEPIGKGVERGDIVQKVIDQIRQIAPRDTASLAMIGDVLINVQRTDLALELYKAVVELNPNNARYRANLAGLYLNQGMKDKAREEALKAAELDPTNFAKQVEEFLKNLE